MKKHIPWIVLIACIATGIRIMYALHSPLYLTTGDSVSYFLTAKKIVETKGVVDPWRTPVYPMLLAVPYIVTARSLPQEISGRYTFGLEWVRVAQSIAMVIAALLLYVSCTYIGIGKPLSSVLAIIATSDVVLLLLEHAILTEAFSFLWLTGVLLLELSLLRRLQRWKGFVMVFLWIVGVFLRPSLIGIPVICVLFIMLRYKRTWVTLACLVALSIYAVSIQAYTHINVVQSGYRGISRIQDVNIWGKLLRMDIKDNDLGTSAMAQKAIAARRVNAVHPFEIFRQYPELYTKENAPIFHEFIMSILKPRLGRYLWDSLLQVASVMTSKTVIIDTTATTGMFDRFFSLLTVVYTGISFILLFSLFGLPMLVYRTLQRRTVESYGQLVTISIGIYHVVVSAGMAYDDFGRLLSVAKPFLLISTYLIFREVISKKATSQDAV